MAMFRNESWILDEWIEHYYNEGVSKFILIDNESTDGWRDKINPKYLEDPNIKFVSLKGSARGRQELVYNDMFKRHKPKTDWLLICDFDEFFYSRKEFKTITEYLDTLPDGVSQVKVPWKIFGSSGHVEHPESTIKGFTHYDPDRHDNKGKPVMHIKSIVRCSRVEKLRLHGQEVRCGKSICVNGKQSVDSDPWVTPYDITDDPLHCNHYYTQSEQYFREIQSKRAGG